MPKQLRLLTLLVGLIVASLATSTAILPAQSSDVPTFSRDVAPILYRNCVSCHRPGEIAPMSLLTYTQARPYARSIRERVELGTMPPWHAEAVPGTFLNERRLSAAEKDTLSRWANNGAPEGDPKDMPPVPVFAEGWTIGKPDAVVTMAEPFNVPAAGTVEYQYFQVPTTSQKTNGYRHRNSSRVRSVVHHVLVLPANQRRRASAAIFPANAGLWVPWLSNSGRLPLPRCGTGSECRFDARSSHRDNGARTNAVIFQSEKHCASRRVRSHVAGSLHRNGKAEQDRSSVGFVFAKEPPNRKSVAQFINAQLVIPAGDGNHRVDSQIEFTEDTHIVALFPHTHLRGKSWEYRLTYPDGREEVVLSVPRYDFNWQTYYEFAKPLAVPKGSRLLAIAHFDNSANNKANPNPGVEVRWGDQTWQEMQYSGITYTVD
jgi:hypothetical protein